MCGIRSSARLCGLVLLSLLCSVSSWADDSREEWYQISESELTELERTLTEQAETIERQQTTIGELSTSFDAYESEAEQTIQTLRIERWVWGGLGLLSGLVSFLILR